MPVEEDDVMLEATEDVPEDVEAVLEPCVAGVADDVQGEVETVLGVDDNVPGEVEAALEACVARIDDDVPVVL